MTDAKTDQGFPDVNDDTHEDIMYPSTIAFILVHLACFGALWSGLREDGMTALHWGGTWRRGSSPVS